MADKYDIRTIIGMARIPEDRLPLFLAELPAAIAAVRGFLEMQAGAAPGVSFSDEQLLSQIRGFEWVDDDRGVMSGTVTVEDMDTGEVEATVQFNAKLR